MGYLSRNVQGLKHVWSALMAKNVFRAFWSIIWPESKTLVQINLTILSDIGNTSSKLVVFVLYLFVFCFNRQTWESAVYLPPMGAC